MGWIGVDLDGTLATYDHWIDVTHVGEPIPEMVERVNRWLAEGREVKIFTARVGGPERAEAIPPIQEWCERVFGVVLPITNVKDFAMDELWDDRVVQVEKNTGKPIGRSTRGLDEATLSNAWKELVIEPTLDGSGVYVRRDGEKIAGSREAHDAVTLDFSEGGELVGVEIVAIPIRKPDLKARVMESFDAEPGPFLDGP